ncbi:MAG: hypothetical protein ACRC0X_09970 [Brevinema sp.]
MSILSIALGIFIVLETANILILYMKPDFPFGNGISVFNAWEKSQQDNDMHLFICYLVYWVAGTKLIFIALLLIILFLGDTKLQMVTLGALILSISSFYWKLYPIIWLLDDRQQLTPVGYSKTLNYMILGFIMMFLGALLSSLWI